jgi:hypothetical protein
MPVNADAARSRSSLGIDILIAESGIGPRPAGTYHQRLEVVFGSKAHRDGTGVPPVIVDLVTRHWAAGNEVNESLRRQRTGIQFAISARSRLLTQAQVLIAASLAHLGIWTKHATFYLARSFGTRVIRKCPGGGRE